MHLLTCVRFLVHGLIRAPSSPLFHGLWRWPPQWLSTPGRHRWT